MVEVALDAVCYADEWRHHYSRSARSLLACRAACAAVACASFPDPQNRSQGARPLVFQLADLYRALRREPPPGLDAADIGCTGLCHDSRILQPGEVFLALRTGQRDGHAFIPDAAAKGAAAILCQRPRAGVGIPQIRVRNPNDAAWKLASYLIRKRPALRIVAVTGSYGKTTTKEAIAAVLAERFRVCKTLGTENNELGIPRTVARCHPADDVLVLEMGAQWRGEIAAYCRRVRPHVGVVTAVGPVHLELFGSLDVVRQAKGELAQALPASGAAVLNGDDARVRTMAARTRVRTIFYGTNGAADVSARNVTLLPDGWTQCDVRVGDRQGQVKTRILGQAGVYAALAAAAVGQVFGLSLAEIAAGLANVRPAPGRLHARTGRNGTILLDDAYNANRVSGILALETLAQLGARGRRFAVLGDMLELGEYAAEEHRLLGEAAARYAYRLIAIGAESAHIAAGARAAGMDPARITEMPADYTDEVALNAALVAAETLLAAEAQPHDAVLVKGSHGMGLYRLAERWAVSQADETPATE